MELSNTQIADNIINLLNKAKENEAFDNNIDKKEQTKLFNKFVKAGMKSQTKINIKTFKKEPSAYNIFVKNKMPEIKIQYPELSGSEIFKKIGALWSEENPKKTNIKKTNIKKTNIKEDDIKEDDIKEDDIKEDDIKEDDIKEDDIKEDDIKEDDIKKDDIKEDDIKKGDIKKGDIKKGDIKKKGRK